VAGARYCASRNSDASTDRNPGSPVHTVAQRIGDDPAVLLRNYARRKRTKTADVSLSDVIEALAANFLGSN
jgi:integrase